MNLESQAEAGAFQWRNLFGWLGRKSESVPKADSTQSDSGLIPFRQPGARCILVVDDDAVLRKALEIKLKSKGYSVLTAAEGPEAIQLVRTEKPDLVLLDVDFPPDVAISWNGFSIMNWLQRVECSKNTPVILMTGSHRTDLAMRAKDEGAAGFFHKPLDFSALFALIEFRLKQTKEAASLALNTAAEI
jgi:DNA-binding response OmpR family regulator